MQSCNNISKLFKICLFVTMTTTAVTADLFMDSINPSSRTKRNLYNIPVSPNLNGYVMPLTPFPDMTVVPEVALPTSFNDQMQRKILGLIMGTAAENALRQMHLTNPKILNTLTGKIIPLTGQQAFSSPTPVSRSMPSPPSPGRRSLFTPTIHNTIVNENKNENKNENVNTNENGPQFKPFLLPADPNFPLLTHLLESILKTNGVNHDNVEHKPLRICFEL